MTMHAFTCISDLHDQKDTNPKWRDTCPAGNELEASTDLVDQSTGLHPSYPSNHSSCCTTTPPASLDLDETHDHYTSSTRSSESVARHSLYDTQLVTYPASSNLEPGTMASSQGSTSATPYLSHSGPSTSSDHTSWLNSGEKRRRSSPEASTSRNPFVRDRRSSMANEDHDELEEEKKPVKRMSVGSAAGLTSMSTRFGLANC